VGSKPAMRGAGNSSSSSGHLATPRDLDLQPGCDVQRPPVCQGRIARMAVNKPSAVNRESCLDASPYTTRRQWDAKPVVLSPSVATGFPLPDLKDERAATGGLFRAPDFLRRILAHLYHHDPWTPAVLVTISGCRRALEQGAHQ
jgi:hypothetical protein